MTKRVQILGHDHETANAFVGDDRELTVDIDNWELRLHDGTTPGGWLIYNRDENDARYQGRSLELDGLLGWEPNERGILVRLGPTNYELREITVNEANLAVMNANGYDGNPALALAPVVTSDHQFAGDVEFTQPVVATGGVAGNLTGNSTGTHTGNVVGNVTGNLTGDASGNHEGTFTGSVDLQGWDLLLDDGQIPSAKIAGLASLIALGAPPIGGIMPYYGDVGDLPVNWLICDGTEGTPDLRDRFIMSAGPTYAPNAAAGAATHTHTISIDSGGAHVHTGTVGDTSLTIAQLPAHHHGNGATNLGADLYCYGSQVCPNTPNSISDNTNNGTIEGLTETIGSGDVHTHTLSIDSGGGHAHTGTTATGSSIPPYYSLVYIMRGS